MIIVQLSDISFVTAWNLSHTFSTLFSITNKTYVLDVILYYLVAFTLWQSR